MMKSNMSKSVLCLLLITGEILLVFGQTKLVTDPMCPDPSKVTGSASCKSNTDCSNRICCMKPYKTDFGVCQDKPKPADRQGKHDDSYYMCPPKSSLSSGKACHYTGECGSNNICCPASSGGNICTARVGFTTKTTGTVGAGGSSYCKKVKCSFGQICSQVTGKCERA